jgi:ParB family chromosome partitioning protein
MTTIEMIPLNKLIPSPANVRKTGALTGIEELAASIAAHGLLQNLQVRPGEKGKFEVVAGGRRLAALQRLAKARTIAKTEEVACHVINGDDAAEISLAENIVRLPMHPADQYEAFKALANQGKGPEEIAGRFGCSPAVVKQRLKLANVSPRLIEAYRNEKIDLDQLMAFAVSDDHAAQEQVWAALPEWNHNPGTIRSHLMVANVDAGDRRAQFVGVTAYRRAGGHILRDLFQPEHDGYLTDVAVLDRLVIEKLEAEAAAIRTEGWSWVEIMPTINHEHLRRLRRVYPERELPTEEQQAAIDALTARYDALVEEHGDDPPDEIMAEIEELSDKIDALSDGVERWLPEDLTRAGAMIGIGHDGKLAVARGLVRAEDDPAETHGAPTSGAKAARRMSGSPILSDRMAEDLTAHRTAALRTVLAGNADVALAAVVHALALPIFFRHETESCLELSLDSAPLHSSAEGIEDSLAAVKLHAQHEFWLRQLPNSAEGLWDWLLAQDTATRLDLLAHCAGCSVNAVKKRHERADTDRLNHADRLALALGLDMRQWWQPTAQSYFRHVPKLRILEAVTEAVTPEAAANLPKLKKDALAAEAEARLAGTDWLPAILRSAAPVTAEPQPEAETLAA